MVKLFPFKRYSVLNFTSRYPTGIYLLVENDESKNALLRMKKSLKGTWYYLWERNIRFTGHYVKQTLKDLQWVKKLKLIPIALNNFKHQKNCIYDITPRIKLIEEADIPLYSKRVVTFVPDFFGVFRNRKNTLVYFIDINKPGPSFRNSKIYPILRFLTRSNYKLFDNLVIAVSSIDRLVYVPVIVDGDYTQIRRVIAFTKNVLKLCRTTNKTKNIADNLKSSKIKQVVSPDVLSKVLVSTNPNIENNKIDINIAIDRIIDDIVPERNRENKHQLMTTLENIIPPNIIEPNTNDNLISEITQINITTAKFTDTLDQYSKQDNKQIIQDISKLLSVYKDTELGVRVLDWKVKDLPIDEKEIAPTLSSLVTLKIQTKDGKIHNVQFKIPRQQEDGTYLIFGNRYIMTNQIYPVPITFPKPGVGRYSSFTCTFLVEKLKTKTSVYIQGCKIPISVLLCYFFDIYQVMTKYNITYKIVDNPEKNEENKSYKLPDGKYFLVIGYHSSLDKLQKDLLDNLFKFKGTDKIKSKPLTKEYFAEFIKLYTGNEDLPEKIDNVLKVALDDKTLELLKEKGFPTNLFDIFKYIHFHVLKGTVSSRNDIVESRLRNNEIISHIAFDTIRKALYEYNVQVKHNKSPKLDIHKDKILSEIVTSSSCQLMEYVNPLEEVTNYFKVTYSGYKGIPKDAVPSQVRTLHPSNYGIVDPVNVPLGDSIGVVQHLTTDLVLTKNGSVLPKEFTDDLKSGIFSITSMTIPFISKNEPTRTMMSANQVRQAVLLKHPQVPLIQTGIESFIPRMLRSDIFVKKSQCKGRVSDITKDSITIKCTNGKTHNIKLEPIKARSGQGYSSLVTFKPKVTKGTKVNENDIIATSNGCKDGILSTGRNCVCAYMFYKGYTYEDGVVIAESLTNKFTSTHLMDYKMFIDEDDRIIYISDKLRKGQKLSAGEELVRAVGTRYIDLVDIGLITTDSFLHTGNKYTLVSPYDAIIHDVKIYLSGIDISKLPNDVISTLRKLKIDLATKSPYLYKGSKFKGVYIQVDLIFEKPMQIGDKITNRAASKGVVCKVVPDKDMPQLPDGRNVEVIFAPLTFINRTNIAQLYELYVGEIAYQLGQAMLKLSKNVFIKKAKLLQLLDNKTNPYIPRFIEFLIKCDDKQYKQLQKFVKENRGIPLVFPQFSDPNYKQILSLMRHLKIPVKQKLRLDDGSLVKAPVGLLYILKLEHMVSHKVFSRSIGPYQSKTGQPTRGKAREGGQRVGEGDSWSLAAWGAENLLKEWFSASSDDFALKHQIYRQIIQTGSASLEVLRQGDQVSKELFRNMMKGMCLDI